MIPPASSPHLQKSADSPRFFSGPENLRNSTDAKHAQTLYPFLSSCYLLYFERKYPNAALESIRKKYEQMGLLPETTYLFLRGHNVYDMISCLCREVCKMFRIRPKKIQVPDKKFINDTGKTGQKPFKIKQTIRDMGNPAAHLVQTGLARRFASDAKMFRCRAAVHVENKDDVVFWSTVLKHFCPDDRFHFSNKRYCHSICNEISGSSIKRI